MNLPEPISRSDLYLNELCKKKLAPLVALNAVNINTLSPELNLTGANSIKFYVEITGTGTIQIDVLGACISGGVFVGNGVSKYFSTSQSFMLPCTSDLVKVQLTVLSGTPTVTIRAQGMSDVGVDDVVPKFKDLGQVINATNVVTGATVYSDFIDNVQWVRNWKALYQTDQMLQIGVSSRDTLLNVSLGDFFTGNQPGNGVGLWNAVNSSALQGLIGYSAKFSVKNTSGNTASFIKLNIQLVGV